MRYWLIKINDSFYQVLFFLVMYVHVGVLREGILQGGTTSVLDSTFVTNALSISIEGQFLCQYY